MKSWASYAVFCCVLFLVGGVPRSASAEPSESDRAAARTLGREALRAAQAQDFVAALDLYARAERLHDAPTLVLGMARAQVALGKLTAAKASSLRLLGQPLPADAPAAFRRSHLSARTELDRLLPRLSHVSVAASEDAAPLVELDGAPLPRSAFGTPYAVDPGAHTLVATTGEARAETTFSVAEGETKSLALPTPLPLPNPPPGSAPDPANGATLGPEAPERDPALTFPAAEQKRGGPLRTASPLAWRRNTGWVSVGVGGAALAASGVLGFRSFSDRADLRARCADSVCPTAAQATHDRMRTTAHAADIAGGIGLVGVAIGASLLLTTPKGPAHVAARCLLRGVIVCAAW